MLGVMKTMVRLRASRGNRIERNPARRLSEGRIAGGRGDASRRGHHSYRGVLPHSLKTLLRSTIVIRRPAAVGDRGGKRDAQFRRPDPRPGDSWPDPREKTTNPRWRQKFAAFRGLYMKWKNLGLGLAA